MQLLVEPNGLVRCVYDETLDLASLGNLSIARGSYVEPNANGHWLAGMSPVAGPVLGPFVHRSQALAAEQRWLDDYWIIDSSKQRSANATSSS